MSNNDSDKNNPWQRSPYWDRPDPDKLQYSDSPYAPDWAKRPVAPSVKTDPAPTVAANIPSTSFPEQIIASGGKPIPDAPELVREHEQIDQASKSVADKGEDKDEERFYPDVALFEAALAKRCDEDHRAYALIDGKYCSGLYGRLLNFKPLWATLLQGKAAQTGIQESTFVVELEFGHRLVQWLIEENWGKGCIVWLIASTKALTERYARTHIYPGDEDSTHRPTRGPFIELPPVPASENEPVQMLRRHFRRFTKMEMEDSGRLLNFRFQDPATLRTYLLSCNEEELSRFLGPITALWIENYSRVPSLNKPHQLYEFRHRVETVKDANGYVHQNISHLDALLYDFINEQRVPFDRLPMQTERPGRETVSSLIILRHGQIKAFEKEELATKYAEIAEQIVQSGFIQKRYGATDKAIFDKALFHIPLALQWNLQTKREIWAFTICSLVYGGDFYKAISDVDQALHARNAGHDGAINLETALTRVADTIIGGQEIG